MVRAPCFAFGSRSRPKACVAMAYSNTLWPFILRPIFLLFSSLFFLLGARDPFSLYQVTRSKVLLVWSSNAGGVVTDSLRTYSKSDAPRNAQDHVYIGKLQERPEDTKMFRVRYRTILVGILRSDIDSYGQLGCIPPTGP